MFTSPPAYKERLQLIRERKHHRELKPCIRNQSSIPCFLLNSVILKEHAGNHFSSPHYTGSHFVLVSPVLSHFPPLFSSPCSSSQLHNFLLILHFLPLFSPPVIYSAFFLLSWLLGIRRKLRGLAPVQNLFMSLFSAAQQGTLLWWVLKRSNPPLALSPWHPDSFLYPKLEGKPLSSSPPSFSSSCQNSHSCYPRRGAASSTQLTFKLCRHFSNVLPPGPHVYSSQSH